MKYCHSLLLLTILFIIVSTAVDQLDDVQTQIVTVASTAGSTNLLASGPNTFPIPFTTTHTNIPSVGLALCGFSSPNTAQYSVQTTIPAIDASQFTLGINLAHNLWTSLSYNVISSVADTIVLQSIILTTGLGAGTSSTPVNLSPTITSPVHNMQDKVKFDVFIVDFDLQPTSSSSEFYINAAINYGSDTMDSLYSDYVYQLNSGSLPGGIAILANTLPLTLTWIGTLSSLQITLISHPVLNKPLALTPLTTGFNTLAVISTSILTNINLFNPTTNKNNLGSLNPAGFYGFTGIGLTPVTTIDASMTLQYSYFVTLVTTSTIDFLKTSYYFYELSANIIVDSLFNQNIPISWSSLGTQTAATSNLNSFYTVTLATAFSSTSSPFNQMNGNTYRLSLQALDSQGCQSITDTFSFNIQLTNDNSNFISLSNSAPPPYIANPTCSATSFATPVENMFVYKSLLSVASSTTSTTVSIISSETAGTIYFKNIQLFSISPNQFIDPNIYETTVNAFYSFYTISGTGTKSFYSQISPHVASNALQMNVQSSASVIITTPSISFTSGTIYTLTYYILDSVGNIAGSSTTPVLVIKLDGSAVSTYTASATILFYSSSFNSATPLTTPIDSNYALFTTSLSPTGSAVLSFELSDQSVSDHIYWIRGITLKNIQYFDPVARTNGNSCPGATYLTSNTQPLACQLCTIRGKTNTGTACACPSTTYQNTFGFCLPCSYSCATCSMNANHCLTCPTGRVLDNTFQCNCIVGYDDGTGTNPVCVTCAYSCANCITSPSHCTSCPTGRVLDNTLFQCNCIVGYDDGTGTNPVCVTCAYSCANCITSPSHCTSCPTGRVLDNTLFQCNCIVGYDDGTGTNPVCVTCHYSCGNCDIAPNNCTSCSNVRVFDPNLSTCTCPSGYYDDGVNSQCVRCSLNCGNCSTSTTHCISCPTGSSLDSATSTCKCPDFYTMISGVCSLIPSQFTKIQQRKKTFSVFLFLRSLIGTKLENENLFGCSSASINYNQKRRKLSAVTLPMTIVNVIILPNNVVQFEIQNPPIDINSGLLSIIINNPNINQTNIQLTIAQIYSTTTMSQVSTQTSAGIASQVLLSILLFVMLVLYVLGYKNNHTISFIQKISFLRFNLLIIPSTFSFLYSLKYSYYAYGKNVLQSVISPNYLENSNGNYYFLDEDANILRNVGIPIVISIALLVLRIVGLVIFRKKDNQVSTQNVQKPQKKLTFETGYYRAIQYFEKTIMFPIMFFSIAEITFANLYGISYSADASTYKTSLAFSVLYIVYFAVLVVITFLNAKISKLSKFQLVSDYVFSLLDSIIIIQTYYSKNVLALMITIVIKCGVRLFLKYTYNKFSKIDLINIIVMSLEIAIIGILSNSSTSLAAIEALFVVIVIIDLIYAVIVIILKLIEQKKQSISDQHEVSIQNLKGLDKITPIQE